jgi:hypothetical protein
MVSKRWFIGEEASLNGNLVIRDKISTEVLGLDARFMFPVAHALNF